MIILTKGPIDMDALLGTSAIKLKKAPTIKVAETEASPHTFYRFFWNSVTFETLGAIMHEDDLCTCKLEHDVRAAVTWLNDARYRYHLHEDRLKFSEKVSEEDWSRVNRYWSDYREWPGSTISNYADYGAQLNRSLNRDEKTKNWETQHLFLYIYDLKTAERFAKKFGMTFTEEEIPWNPAPKPVPAPVFVHGDLDHSGCVTPTPAVSPGWQFASPTIDTQSAEPPTRRWLSKMLFGNPGTSDEVGRRRL
jgi:hypothetical protein